MIAMRALPVLAVLLLVACGEPASDESTSDQSQVELPSEAIAEPENWAPDSKEKPPRLVVKDSKKIAAVKRGDRILARNEETARGWVAHPMKKLPARTEGLMGVVEFDGAGKPWLAPVDKRVRDSAPIGELGEAEAGDLVLAERMGKSARSKVKVVEVIGDPLAPKAFSLIAIAKHGIPHVFPQETITEAERAVDLPLSSEHREDLRDVPIVAIDPADARDHDDAIWAEPDGKGGYRAIIAIADVSYYVRPGGDLDREARKRGNSVYFPDRVVPMLPDRLSGDLCSLHEDVDRPHQFGRALDHRRDGCAVGHVDRVPQPAELLGYGHGSLFVDIRHHDPRAFGQKAPRDARAEARSGAGDDGDS